MIGNAGIKGPLSIVRAAMPSPTLPPVPISAQAVRIGPLKGTAAMGGATTVVVTSSRC